MTQKVKDRDRQRRGLWSLAEGESFCRELYKFLAPIGYSVAITGSVLFKGKSFKDLDLIIYPLSTARVDVQQLRNALKEAGLRIWMEVDEVHEAWLKKGSNDTKHVEVWRFGVRRVDLFFLK